VSIKRAQSKQAVAKANKKERIKKRKMKGKSKSFLFGLPRIA